MNSPVPRNSGHIGKSDRPDRDIEVRLATFLVTRMPPVFLGIIPDFKMFRIECRPKAVMNFVLHQHFLHHTSSDLAGSY